MFQENQKVKQRALDNLELERLEDIKSQEAYALMLQKQEEDRSREVKAREDRAQEFMNRMADTVIKDMDAKAHEEEMKIRRYEMELDI